MMIKIGSTIVNVAHIVAIQYEELVIMITTINGSVRIGYTDKEEMDMEYNIICQILGVPND